MAAKKMTKKAVTKSTPRKVAARKPIERQGVMELAGKPATIVGADVKVGQRAPRFTAQAGLWPGINTWAPVDVLTETAGKVRILAAVPSLSTNTCDAETRRFNEEAAGLGDDIRIITLSADLPATQKNWCAAAGVERVYTVSDHMDLSFGTKYATHMKERRWHRRAVFIVGKDDRLAYVAYMPQLGVEPNYAEVIDVAKRLVAA
jgi:thiol peroxidase